MTQNDILTLAKAGFTAQQIAAMNAVSSAPQSQPLNQPFTPQPNIGGKLDELMSVIQMGNIAQSQQPQPQSTDDILAEIINPPTLNNGGMNK